ncbi:MAG: glycerophosphodiester phosphodiesterase [Clostridia bacterium]|nr:glycerophosphodiester phosphodiesterase [Clostridia bacterium]
MLLIILVLLALALFLIAPSTRGRANSWRGTSFAHRGLHSSAVSENSLRAFELACRAGTGIELDVQLSSDGQVVVFHDDTLKRMTGDTRRVDEATLADLRALSLPDVSQIPTFEEVLRLVNGRAPLLVELKNGRRNAELCRRTMQLLSAYNGPYIVESFNPLILLWFRKNAPQVIRGQLVSSIENYTPQFSIAVGFMLASLALNFLTRPDFIAYDANAAKFFTPRIIRALFQTPLAPWTITSPAAYAAALERREMPIFEGFTPEKRA